MPQTQRSNQSTMLRKEQIEGAKQDRSHIVIQTFDALGAEHWKNLVKRLRTDTNNQRQQKECRDAIVPFAEALDGKAFTLEPLDIVSIWSRAMEVFPNTTYPRYSLSTAIACAFGALPIKSEDWKNLFKKMNENRGSRYLEDLARKDRANSIIFGQRLTEISASREELDYYTYGTRENMSDLVNMAYGQGDKEAEKRYEQIIKWEKAHKDTVLGAIHENWSNGVSWMRILLLIE